MKTLLKRTLITTISLSFLFLTFIFFLLRASLPILDGEHQTNQLQRQVTIHRDKNGYPTIHAPDQKSAAFTLGFLHAQERFFQMDILRRTSAGELSELVGPAALDMDRQFRVHQFRKRLSTNFSLIPQAHQDLLRQYTKGVNEGLIALGAKPFEYLLLGVSPKRWTPIDSMLVVASMYLDLQDHTGKWEQNMAVLSAVLTKETVQFLVPEGTPWDAALDGTKFQMAALPELQLPQSKKTFVHQERFFSDQGYPGSNSWAISGELTQHDSAMLANDMHLNIGVPNIWYKASLDYQHAHANFRISGVTLPGTPGVVAGSNGHIAWGFTNSYGDYSDVIQLDVDKASQKYRTPFGWEPLIQDKETIRVRGADSEQITVSRTHWGPVIDNDQSLALRWVAYDPEGINAQVWFLGQSFTTKQAIELAHRAGIPAQNMVIADTFGDIIWTIMGPIPKRAATLGQTPKPWHDTTYQWFGYRLPHEYPMISSPPHQRIWTANNRIVGGKNYQTIGNGGYALGARAQQIRSRLFAQDQFTEAELLHIQYDYNGVYLKRWQNFLIQHLERKTHHAESKELLRLLDHAQLQARRNSNVYLLVHHIQRHIKEHVYADIMAQLIAYAPTFKPALPLKHALEEPLWQLVTKQPSSWLPAQFSSWENLIDQAIHDALEEIETNHGNWKTATWGDYNRSRISHPLASGIPVFGQFLNMPEVPMDGERSFMPMITQHGFGASQRMVVSPGNEDTGILQMPSSQSGHPLSPYYGVGHQDWLNQVPTPFLPGKKKYTLVLKP
ncbi:penicillin acylase family protein [Algicola sagamiensis]|uniref:penicillin acylase family protein n=1 Tax=Algicola sagamiensis TaxID=163869 RepID=UPI000366E2C3|nr:penicillin acylase family protein [Algicola sagamiensis]